MSPVSTSDITGGCSQGLSEFTASGAADRLQSDGFHLLTYGLFRDLSPRALGSSVTPSAALVGRRWGGGRPA